MFFHLGAFSWEFSPGSFSLGTFSWELSQEPFWALLSRAPAFSRGAGAGMGVGMLRGGEIPFIENKKIHRFKYHDPLAAGVP